jgi:glycerophosphoryl diester phosphodiesterase
MPAPIIAGHRGAAHVAPENTLPSFRAAVDAGATLVELDVQLTRDGFPVCFHDDRLERITQGEGPLAEWDWERLSALAFKGEKVRGDYSEARIPLLSDALCEIARHCTIIVELKADPRRAEELVRRTLDVVREGDAFARCRFISFEQELLARLRDVALAGDGEPELGVLIDRGGLDRLLPRARELKARALHPKHTLIEAELARACERRRFLVMPGR